MKKQQLKDIITNQNELIEYWRTRASGFERLYDHTDRILRMCEDSHDKLFDENERLIEQIGEIRECRDLDRLKERDQENTPNEASRPTWKERFHEAVIEVRERGTEIYELKKEIKAHLRALDDAERERVKMAIEIDKLKHDVEYLRTTKDYQVKEINRLHGLA